MGNNTYDYNEFSHGMSAWLITSLVVLGFIFMTNRQRYFRHHAFWSVALLTLPIVTVPAMRWGCGGPACPCPPLRWAGYPVGMVWFGAESAGLLLDAGGG